MSTPRIYSNIRTKRRYDVRNGFVSKLNDKGKYDANLFYNHIVAHSSAPQENYWIGDRLDCNAWLTNPGASPVGDVNRLYSKVREVVNGPKGELLTSAVEWKSSFDMITKRAIQLGRAYSALKKLRFREVSDILGITSKKTRKRILKKVKDNNRLTPTQLWLEYWMGWAPLHGDIAHALETIVAPPPLNQNFREAVRLSYPVYERKASNPAILLTMHDIQTNTGQLAAYGTFKITNHNLYVLNQLGFVNPALTAWQIVPFSFIVDWFMNVADCIGAFTDFVGVSFENTGTARKVEIDVSTYFARREYDYSSRTFVYPSSKQTGHGEIKERRPGPIPQPRLSGKMLDSLSKTRAATSISLLVEIFLRK